MTNTPKFLFLSIGASNFFQIYGPPQEEWFTDFSKEYISLPSFINSSGDVIVVTPNEISDASETIFHVLVASESGLIPEFKPERKREVFSRILRLAQSVLDQSITIPAMWRPFNQDSLITIQASPLSTGNKSRILFDRKVHGLIAGVCYGVSPLDLDFSKEIPETIQENLLENRLTVLQSEFLSTAKHSSNNDLFELELNNKALGLGDSLKTWYDSKLTTSQRQFSDSPLDRSVRARGPAGSGKTIALVVKLLRQFESDRASNKQNRYALLTHSEATIELIHSMIRTMVPGIELSRLTKNSTLLYLGTLYSIAFDTLGAELRGVSALSLDGRQGRELQRELLDSVFADYMKENWIANRSDCSVSFVERFERARDFPENREHLLLEILNEFACVLEPEGIARSATKRDEYISRTSREPWRLHLTTPGERRIILDLNIEFRKQMRGMDAISMDQLISDFDRFLDSNAWELTRATHGFDCIFVDELHLLNRTERMLITSLMKNPDSKPIVVMAEDIKQDIKRVGSGLKKWQTQFDGLENFELNEVFRYTPEINNFLLSLDAFSPTLNLGDDWPDYQQQSKLPSGPKPLAQIFISQRAQYDAFFPAASISAKKRKLGRMVAILTCDYSSFKKYINAGQHRDLFIPVESREDIASIPNRGTRFILSMPEFVAGLQFEEVYLIDVSESVLAGGESVGVSDKRRGLSMVYLGSSRAMKHLHLSALKDAGGFPSFIHHAITSGVCDSPPK